MSKLLFLQTELPILLRTLSATAKGEWGVLNGQQMIEHLADAISYASGNNNQTLHSPIDQVDKYKAFAMSDKEFKPNTKNVLMSETPTPVLKSTVAEALEELEKQITAFINYFETNKGATITNPFFGELNFEEWTHLLHKHAVHHCKQFRLL
jgi:DinB superfamily